MIFASGMRSDMFFSFCERFRFTMSKPAYNVNDVEERKGDCDEQF